METLASLVLEDSSVQQSEKVPLAQFCFKYHKAHDVVCSKEDQLLVCVCGHKSKLPERDANLEWIHFRFIVQPLYITNMV